MDKSSKSVETQTDIIYEKTLTSLESLISLKKTT